MTLDPRARTLADDPLLRPVWSAVHRRIEESGADLDTTCKVKGLDPDQRRELDLLLGTRTKAASPTIALGALDARLRARAGAGLIEIVTTACGPLRDLPGERLARATSRDQLWEATAAHPAVAANPALADWFVALRRSGRVTRLENPVETLLAALDVVAAVHDPGHTRTGRAMLAAAIIGDAHALDADAPVGRLAVAALAHLAGLPANSAVATRAVWERYNVTSDETSSSVLVAGFRPLPVGPLTEAARRWADGAVALHVPLAAVRAESFRLAGPLVVHVCENPAVLDAALDRLGPRCPPLVCVEGNPTLAAMELLGVLRETGTELVYHGDFGTGGIQIANLIVGNLDARPWRMSLDHWRRSYERLGQRRVTLPPLRGVVPCALWDDRLADAINVAGVEVEEEHVIDELLADLHPAD